jgi:hypothetical protein
MTEKQNIELPTIKYGLGFSSSPEYTLLFKNTESIEQWRKQVKAIAFAEDHFLVEGYICLCKIEQPETKAEPAKPAPRVPGSVGKAQSFTIDGSGIMTRPY